ncbi:hypothetical protein RB593_001456 [Gaeumannomyces tritici]
MGREASTPRRPKPLDLANRFIMVPDALTPGMGATGLLTPAMPATAAMTSGTGPTGLLTPATTTLSQTTPPSTINNGLDGHRTMGTSIVESEKNSSTGTHPAHDESSAKPSHGVKKNPYPPYEPIAIIGMGMRLPGGVHDDVSYWDLLVNGKDGRCRVPESRYHAEAWVQPPGSNKPPSAGLAVPSTHGYFLATDADGSDPLQRLDGSFWTLGRHEAEALDPQQRLFLEVVHEALETAGLTPSSYRGADVGMYVGQMCDDWAGMQRMDRLDHGAARAEVVGDYIVANRASYEFDLRGPSVVVRTACSSSLVALHMACRDLQARTCGAAIVGGVNVMVTPLDTVGMNVQGVLSPSGRCMAFDADADGYARGEGVSAVCVKRLDDALRDGDPIRAVIRASCVSSDGQGGGRGITSPDGGAHERIMRRAYDIAEIGDLGRTAMVECHGTGTAVGDPIEAGAVAKLWGKDGIYIGSVKGNIGHGEGASGLSSLMKMVLALEHSTIPPNIHFNTPNPRIPWQDAKLTVPTKASPWPSDRLERVSVNSFGIGGTNAHVILESASCAGVLPRPIPGIGVETSENRDDDVSSQRLLVFSAKHPKALERSAEAVRNYLADRPVKLGDMAYSLATHRAAYSQRAFAVVGSDEASSFRVEAGGTALETQPSVAWVFTGQGAQWPQMGKELLEKEPLVRQRVEHFDRLLASLSKPPPFTIKDEIMKPPAHSRLYEAQYSQPCMVALQLSIVDLLKSWGVKPAAVVGHSSGETAAAYAAGAVTADDAFLLAYHRGQITPTLAKAHDGSMAAIGLGRDAVTPFLQPGVIIGCENSPESVTLSGEKDVLTSVMAAISAARPEVLCRKLKVECGYHSQHMAAVADEYWSRVTGPDGVRGQAVEPAITFYSSVNAGPTKDLSPKHFLDNLLSPVLFDGAVRALLRDLPTPPVFVEIGPHAALAGPIRQIVHSEAAAVLSQRQNQHHSPQQQKEAQHTYIPTLVRSRDGMVCLLETAGKLWLAGAAIQPRAVNPPGGSFLRDMPTYQWHYEDGSHLWRETRISREWRLRRFPHHELLGSRCVETGDACPAWRCRLSPADEAPWLREHVVRGAPVLPAAAFVVMIGEALRQLGAGRDGFSLKSVEFSAPLALDRDETVELITALMPIPDGEHAGWYHFSISSIADIKSGGACTQHATGSCAAGAKFQLPAPNMAASTASLVRQVNHDGFYDTWRRFGLDYGPQFRRIRDARSHVSERRAAATIDTSCAPEDEDAYCQAAMHPTSLDAAFHACMVAGCVGLERNFERLAVPQHIEEVYVKPQTGAATAAEMTVVTEAFENVNGVSCSNVFGTSKTSGEILLHVRGLKATPLPEEISPEGPADRHLAAVLQWKPDVDFGSWSYWIRPNKRQYKAQVASLMGLLGHKTPAMRILEVETQHGTNMTDAALQALKSGQGTPLYSEYALVSGSDASSKLAREHFGQTARMRFAKANLGPEGFDLAQALKTPAPFDLVILNSDDSDSLKDLLQATRPLLSARGRLIISDTIATAGNDDTVVDKYKHYMGRMDSLRRTLSTAGFLTQREVVYSYGASTIMATPTPPDDPQPATPPSRPNKTINVLARSTRGPRVSAAASQLRARGYRIQWFLPGQLLPTRQATVSLLDLDEERGPFLHGMGPDDLAALKVSVLSLQGTAAAAPQMLWVTGAAQVRCVDPRWALVLGFARSVRRETGVDLVTLELESFDADGWAAVVRVLDGFDTRWRDADEEDGVDPESEYVFSGGEIQIGRFDSVDLPEKLLERVPDGEGEDKSRKVLTMSKHDGHTSLEWKQEAVTTGGKVNGNTVQVQVQAFSIPHGGLQTTSEPSLTSTELTFLASGVISAIGPQVDKLGVGDRVVMLASGSIATSVQISEDMCFRIRDDMEFEEAVKLPLLEYCSAFQSLDTLAGLEKGQSILIHSAETPIGRAALEIALERHDDKSDDIFATVTNAAEAEEVMTKFHLASDHVFISGSTTSFLRSVTEATAVKGVDIVLSTFADPRLVEASWKCLTPYGHLIQLAGWDASPRTRDSGEQLRGIDILRDSKTFSRVDLAQVLNRRPHSLHSHLRKAMAYCRTGNTSAINRHIKVLEGDGIKNGIKVPRSPGDGTSLLVAKLPEDAGALRVAPARRKLALREDRTYIVVGGVGGLGIPCARFLAERGARRLMLFSRSAERFATDNPLMCDEFKAMGCSVRFVSGSITQAADVERLVAAAETPVGGIIHSAMVLQDSHLANMTHRQWRDVIDAKVQGTWNLHSATTESSSQPLDFFVLFSSLAGLGGQVGQANYAAANAFQDAFVQHRRARGLPCAALDIGIMEGVGILARETARLEALRSVEHHVLHERELLDALELAILDDGAGGGGGGGGDNNINNNVARKSSSAVPAAAGYVSAGQMAIGLGFTAAGQGLTRQSAWRRDPRMQMGRCSAGHDDYDDETTSKEQQQQKSNSGAQQLADALAHDAHEQTAASREALTRTLARELAATVRQLTMRDADDGNLDQDAGAPMRSLGVDSLVSVELRGWLRRRAKVALSVQDVRGAETLADLARLVTQKTADARGAADRHSDSRVPIGVPG